MTRGSLNTMTRYEFISMSIPAEIRDPILGHSLRTSVSIVPVGTVASVPLLLIRTLIPMRDLNVENLRKPVPDVLSFLDISRDKLALTRGAEAIGVLGISIRMDDAFPLVQNLGLCDRIEP